MFTFDTVNEDISNDELLMDGLYEFKIKDAVQKDSVSSGKPMIALTLVINSNKKNYTVFDYLSSSPHEFCLKKIRDFCYSVGIDDKYNEGTFEAQDVIGRHGLCKIIIDNKVTDKFPKRKNKVATYIIPKKDEKNAPFINDDIPF